MRLNHTLVYSRRGGHVPVVVRRQLVALLAFGVVAACGKPSRPEQAPSPAAHDAFKLPVTVYTIDRDEPRSDATATPAGERLGASWVAIRWPGHSYELMTTEMTRGMWTDLMGAAPEALGCDAPTCPAVWINTWRAMAAANAASRRADLPQCYDLSKCVTDREVGLDCKPAPPAVASCQGYRLPTPQEWSTAALAGASTEWPCGDTPSCLDASEWLTHTVPTRQPQPVATRQANGFGLHDLIGNVAEMTYEPAPRRGAYAATEMGCGYVLTLKNCRLRNVASRRPRFPERNVGFRLARTLPPVTPAP